MQFFVVKCIKKCYHLKQLKQISRKKGGDGMNLTASEAELRLITERRRRTQIQNEIETLRQCERDMDGIKQSIEMNVTAFREASRRAVADWRGQSGDRYNGNRAQARTNGRSYVQGIDGVIGRISSRRSNLSTGLTTVNGTIRDLERIANGGI
jgi:uncharacterized protein YukE